MSWFLVVSEKKVNRSGFSREPPHGRLAYDILPPNIYNTKQ